MLGLWWGLRMAYCKLCFSRQTTFQTLPKQPSVFPSIHGYYLWAAHLYIHLFPFAVKATLNISLICFTWNKAHHFLSKQHTLILYCDGNDITTLLCPERNCRMLNILNVQINVPFIGGRLRHWLRTQATFGLGTNPNWTNIWSHFHLRPFNKQAVVSHWWILSVIMNRHLSMRCHYWSGEEMWGLCVSLNRNCCSAEQRPN